MSSLFQSVAKSLKARIQEIDFVYQGKIKVGYSIYALTNLTGTLPEIKVNGKKCFELIEIRPSFSDDLVFWNITDHRRGKYYTRIKSYNVKTVLGITVPTYNLIKSKMSVKIHRLKYALSAHKDGTVTVLSYCESVNLDLIQSIFPLFVVENVHVENTKSKHFLIKSL